MLTPIDVSRAFELRFAAVVTGQLAPDGTNLVSPVALNSRYYFETFAPGDTPSKTPYAVFTVESEGVEQFGGGAFADGTFRPCNRVLTAWRVNCRVTCDANWSATPAAVQAALMTDFLAKWGENSGWALPAGHAMLVVRLADAGMGLYPTLRNGSDSTFFTFDLSLLVAGVM